MGPATQCGFGKCSPCCLGATAEALGICEAPTRSPLKLRQPRKPRRQRQSHLPLNEGFDCCRFLKALSEGPASNIYGVREAAPRGSGPVGFIAPAVIYGPGNCCGCSAAALCGTPGSSRGSGARRAATGRQLGAQGGALRLLRAEAGPGVLTRAWRPRPGVAPGPGWAPKAEEAGDKSTAEGSLLLRCHQGPPAPCVLQAQTAPHPGPHGAPSGSDTAPLRRSLPSSCGLRGAPPTTAAWWGQTEGGAGQRSPRVAQQVPDETAGGCPHRARVLSKFSCSQ